MKNQPNSSLHVLFGKYKMPASLRKLHDLFEQCKAEGMDEYDVARFYPITDNFRYFNTPLDVIPFGSTGMDGIHYGFLTDFGTVPDLEQAIIVCVSPMDFDQPVHIIARNFLDFLRLNMTHSELFYNVWENEEAYRVQKLQWENELSCDRELLAAEEKRRYLLTSAFELPNIVNPYQYVQSIKEERRQHVAFVTRDGLGIARSTELSKSIRTGFAVPQVDEMEMEELESFWQSASRSEQLALIRDLQFTYILRDEPELFAFVVGRLEEIGLSDEAKRLKGEYEEANKRKKSQWKVVSSVTIELSREAEEEDETD